MTTPTLWTDVPFPPDVLRERGACAGLGPDLFFPEDGKTDEGRAAVARAKAVCAGCDVFDECAAYASSVASYNLWGVWAGTTREQRRRREEAARGGPVPRGPIQGCGTPAGYATHKRRGEPVCQPCRDAVNAYDRWRTAVNKHGELRDFETWRASPDGVARKRENWIRPCGTPTAARRHRDAGEPLCGPCRDIWREYQIWLWAKQKSRDVPQRFDEWQASRDAGILSTERTGGAE